MAIGADIGGVAGAIIGTAIAPGPGTAIGASLGSAAGGGFDAIQGAARTKAANKLLPPEVDPMVMNNLSQINLQRRQLMTGTAFNNARGEINQNLGATQQGIIQSTGGAGGAAIAGLLRASTAAGDNYAKVVGAGLQQQDQMNSAYNAILQRVAARKLAIQKQNYAQKLATATNEEQTGTQDLMGGLARAGGAFANSGGGGGGKGYYNQVDTSGEVNGFSPASDAPIGTPYGMLAPINSNGNQNYSLPYMNPSAAPSAQ